jgi:hypothetical protein
MPRGAILVARRPGCPVSKRIWRWLVATFSRPRDYYRPGADPFLEIDPDEVRKKLEPARRGEANGTADYPPSSATSLDQNELERCVKECELRLSSYAERLMGLTAASAVPDLNALAAKTKQNLLAIGDRGANELYAERRRLAGLSADLERFKSEHRLIRQPLYPDSKWLHYGLLCVILGVEVVLNGTMLARGNELGFLGGGTQAFVLAAMNLTVAFAVGKWCLTQTQHKSRIRKSVGFVAIALYATAAVFFNLAVGHYRDALGDDDIDGPAAYALGTLQKSPLRLADLQSYALTCAGLTFAMIACLDGYRTDDPYPGYGKLARLVEEAQGEFAVERSECVAEAAEERDRGLGELRHVATSVDVGQRQFSELLNRQHHIVQRFVAHRDYVQSCLDAIVGEYRTANQRVRRTAAPTYFEMRPKLREYHFSEFKSDGLDSKSVRQAGEQATAIITSGYETAVARLQSVEAVSTVVSRYEATAN